VPHELAGVWAIRDVVRGPMLRTRRKKRRGGWRAHRWPEAHVDFNTIPWVIYTTRDRLGGARHDSKLKAEGVAYRAALSRSCQRPQRGAPGDTSGLVNSSPTRSRCHVLGVHIIGAFASS